MTHNCFAHPHYQTAKQRQQERAMEDLNDHIRRSDRLRNLLVGRRVLESV